MSHRRPLMSDEKRRNIIQNVKLRLSAKPFDGGRPPQLVVDTYNQNPQFTVWTGAKQDTNSKIPISARMDPQILFEVLNTILLACSSRDPQCEFSKKNEHKPQNGNKQLVSTTHVGKDENGVYICVEDADARRPKIRFYFGYNPFHGWVQGKEPGDRIQQSILSARSWVEAIKALYPVSLAGECAGGLPAAITPFNKANGATGQPNRSYGNQGGNSGGSYPSNRPSNNDSYDDDDDDIAI